MMALHFIEMPLNNLICGQWWRLYRSNLCQCPVASVGNHVRSKFVDLSLSQLFASMCVELRICPSEQSILLQTWLLFSIYFSSPLSWVVILGIHVPFWIRAQTDPNLRNEDWKITGMHNFLNYDSDVSACTPARIITLFLSVDHDSKKWKDRTI